MSHLTDADLVLYRQNEAPDQAAVAAHLESCARCRAELDTLSRVLALVETDTAPVREASYGVSVWNAIEARLDAAPPERGWSSWLSFEPTSVRGWLRVCAPPAAFAGAMAALLLLVFSGRVPVTGPGTPPDNLFGQPDGRHAAAPGPARPGGGEVLIAAVEDHLERTGLMLTELNNAEDGEDVRDVHVVAEDLAAANRLYRQSAALSGDARIGRLLDELEPLLLEVAHAPDDPATEVRTIETLRGRLDTRGAAFKLRLASAELRARETGGDADAGL
jgi:hypothetical protein